jgi:hypothetical protein
MRKMQISELIRRENPPIWNRYIQFALHGVYTVPFLGCYAPHCSFILKEALVRSGSVISVTKHWTRRPWVGFLAGSRDSPLYPRAQRPFALGQSGRNLRLSIRFREIGYKLIYIYIYDLRFSRQWLRRIASSGMLRRVALVRTDVSEELGTFFIRVTRIGELGTTLAVTSNRRTQRLPWWRRR